tara:strand:- start:742 stop:1029 length:288 start_codon:yes stop_codon:yes gene_type:complete
MIEWWDNNISETANIASVIGAVFTFSNNLPQIWKTIKTKGTEDFSYSALTLRFVGTSLWLLYSIYLKNFLVLISSCISFFSAFVLFAYKIQSSLY